MSTQPPHPAQPNTVIDRSQPRPPPPHALLARLREARFHGRPHCPHCACVRVHAWGSFSGRQRYRCTACPHTFSDLTHTPAAYSKKLALWEPYAECIAAGATIRQAAAALGIANSTAFRWRHALLDTLWAQDHETLTGTIEIRDLWFAYSEKGQRNLDRPARQRGPQCRTMFPGGVVRVILACDRRGGVVTDLAASAIVRFADLEDALAHRIAPASILLAKQGRLGPVARLARRVKGEFITLRAATRGHHHPPDLHARSSASGPQPPPDDAASHGERREVTARAETAGRARTMWHLRTSTAYEARLMGWIRRFRGVATKYLPNYLIWHRTVDASHRYATATAALRWPASSGFT